MTRSRYGIGIDESSQDWKPGTDYVYNIKSRTVHRRVDGRTYESCNVDQIVRLTRSHDLMMIIRMHKGAVFCKRCFRTFAGLIERYATEEPDGGWANAETQRAAFVQNELEPMRRAAEEPDGA